jgi:alpha-beta hydrolase superfamily lysophospholipase
MSDLLRRRDLVVEDSENRPLFAHEVSPEAGSRHVVLCVHGNTFPSVCEFDLDVPGHSMMGHFASEGFHAICFDQRGYGASWKPKRYEPIGMKEKAEDLASIVRWIKRELKPSSLSVLGLSSGCNVISEFLTREGSNPFNRIELMGPPYLIGAWLGNWIKKYRLYRVLLFLAGKGGDLYRPLTVEKLEERLLKGEEDRISRSTLDVFLKQAMSANPEGDGQALVSPVMAFPPREWKQQDPRPLFDAGVFTTPTLILRGQNDEICTQDQADRLMDDLPEGIGELKIFPNRKHDFCLYDEHLDTFESMSGFLKPLLDRATE